MANTIPNMTVGHSYQCTKTVGHGKDISFKRGNVYKCTDATPYLFDLINEQGQRHPWPSQKGCDLHGHINSGWADNWTDFFIELPTQSKNL